MAAPTIKVKVAAGATFTTSYCWCESPYVHKTIASVARGLPTVLTATAHGIPAGVTIPIWISNARGPKINTTEDDPWLAVRATDDTLTLVNVNTGGQAAYTASSGTLSYLPPKDLTGASAKCQFRTTADSDTVLVECLSTGLDPEITISEAVGLLTMTLTPAQSRALHDGSGETTSGIAQMEVTLADGTVVRAFELQWTCYPEGTREDA